MSKPTDPTALVIRMALAPDKKTGYNPAGYVAGNISFWDVTSARRRAANEIARMCGIRIQWAWVGNSHPVHGPTAFVVTKARKPMEPRHKVNNFHGMDVGRIEVFVAKTPSELAAWLLAYYKEHKPDGPSAQEDHEVRGYPAG